MHRQTGDCVTAAVRRPQALAFAVPCVCVCIARTLERKALGAVPAPVNQKEGKQNINVVLRDQIDKNWPLF